MKRFINFLRGTLRLCITGTFPERLLNLCAQEGLDFWAVECLDSYTIRMTIRRSAWKSIKEFARRVGCEVRLETSTGLPDFFLRFRRRYAFLVGLTCSLCAVGFLSQFVLTIEVAGNETVPTAVILSHLRYLGVKPGVYGPALDRQQLAQEMLLEMEELAWMGINRSGTKLQVQVRERAKQPKRVEENEFYHVVAEADGLITQVEAELGDALVKEGDIVTEGQVLISGTVTLEPPQYSDLPNRYYQKHARGRVWARTWRTLQAVIPLEAGGKVYTGQEKTAWSVTVLDRHIEIFGNSSISWPFYDKITTVHQASLPDGTQLPFWLTREQYCAYTPTPLEINREAAQDLLERSLQRRLEELVGEDGSILEVQYAARVSDGCLMVTASAECSEEIGRELPGALPEAEDSGEPGFPP